MNNKAKNWLPIIAILFLLSGLVYQQIQIKKSNKAISDLYTNLHQLSEQATISDQKIIALQNDNKNIRDKYDRQNNLAVANNAVSQVAPKENFNFNKLINLCNTAYLNSDYNATMQYSVVGSLFNQVPADEKQKLEKLYNNAKTCDIYLTDANRLFEQKKFVEAYKNYQAVIEINPDDQFSTNRLAECEMTFEENMVFVKGGSFDMGNNLEEVNPNSDEFPVHKVSVESYYMNKFEVTAQQYARFLNSYKNGSYVKSGQYTGEELLSVNESNVKKINGLWQPDSGQENKPVHSVSWYGAYEFCQFYNFRLPTEAEWEYAAGGGEIRNSDKFSGSDAIADVSWYIDNAETIKPVGTKKPNTLGIYDLSGNVYEWCSSWYQNYDKKAQKNEESKNVQGSFYRVIRGGSWLSEANDNRIHYRNFVSPFFKVDDLGFRFVKNAPNQNFQAQVD